MIQTSECLLRYIFLRYSSSGMISGVGLVRMGWRPGAPVASYICVLLAYLDVASTKIRSLELRDGYTKDI